MKSYNEVLNVKLDDIKSQMSSMNAEKTTKMNYIVQMQSNIKSDLMEIRTNMQFLSEMVSAMISSSTDEIMKRFGHQKSNHRVGDKDPLVVGGSDKTEEVKTVEPNVDRKGKGKLDPTDDIVLPYTLEAPSFDLEGTTTAEPTSELPVKRVSRLAKILQSPFVAGERKLFKLFKYDDIVVSENYKGRVDEIDSSASMAWFQRGYKPRTNHDCGIFVILYALYILREGKESIPHTFDASKCRMDIVTLLYKYREMYVKKARQPTTGEGIVIE
ncbi:Hypothetical predicted protein [Olea europaea subsp. europaea]|uniref:Uncharacterized protein n=1 Tax=Olea europaea subsp. europaea TaxID=158383 RepID=A0A8S0UWW9_OLEEU|nr:Hypothetical predicted protein [Olea europaea subsp. europaea]